MYGFDLIVVSLWFLPAILFIIMPLTIGCLWGALSFVAGLLGQKETQPGASLTTPEPAS